MENQYQFIVSVHYATGEGSTINLLIVPSSYDKNLVEQLFIKAFDQYYLSSLEYATKEEFLEYKAYIPSAVLSIINGTELTPSGFSWYSSCYKNYA